MIDLNVYWGDERSGFRATPDYSPEPPCNHDATAGNVTDVSSGVLQRAVNRHFPEGIYLAHIGRRLSR